MTTIHPPEMADVDGNSDTHFDVSRGKEIHPPEMADVDGNKPAYVKPKDVVEIHPPEMADVDGNDVAGAPLPCAWRKIHPPEMADVDGNKEGRLAFGDVRLIHPPEMADVDGNPMWPEQSILRMSIHPPEMADVDGNLLTFTQSSGISKFIRQKWRMWIETTAQHGATPPAINSSARNGGCGLKLMRWTPCACWQRIHPPEMADVDGNTNGEKGIGLTPKFIRQKWRMWIETI